MNDGGIPEAKCPKCGARYFGWALRNPEYQTCPNCGTKLEITEGGGVNDTSHEEQK